MKRTTTLTVRVALLPKSHTKRSRVTQSTATPPTTVHSSTLDCEALAFLDWLTATNLGSEPTQLPK